MIRDGSSAYKDVTSGPQVLSANVVQEVNAALRCSVPHELDPLAYCTGMVISILASGPVVLRHPLDRHGRQLVGGHQTWHMLLSTGHIGSTALPMHCQWLSALSNQSSECKCSCIVSGQT